MTPSDEQIRAMLRRRAGRARVELLDSRLAAAVDEMQRTPRLAARRRSGRAWLITAVAASLVVLLLAGGILLRQPGPGEVAGPQNRTSAARVDALFASYTDASPGCAVAISQDGSVVFAGGYGLADLATRTPIDPSTIFDVANVSSESRPPRFCFLPRTGG